MFVEVDDVYEWPLLAEDDEEVDEHEECVGLSTTMGTGWSIDSSEPTELFDDLGLWLYWSADGFDE